MTDKFTVFFNFHITSSAPFIVFADGSSKCSTGIVNLTSSLAFTDDNYIPHVFFNLVYVSHLTKTLQCSINFSPSSCTVQDLQMKVFGARNEQDGLYYL